MMPRAEYPRPQFVRENWQNLNGPWEFEIDHGDSGLERGLHEKDASFTGSITVPFCPESKLSGVEHKDFMPAVWYRRQVFLSQEQLDGRVLLHFGAADYETHVFVNGQKAGEHKGGYVSFYFEITGYLAEGENSITVCCRDDVRGGRQPRGKQSAQLYSHGCDYTRTTGIWQTVWLEFTPKTYLRQVRCVAPMNGQVQLCLGIGGCGKDLRLRATVFWGEEQVAEAFTPAQAGDTHLSLFIPQKDIRLWNVGEPNLYDIEYALYEGEDCIDTVKGYFGLRSIELREGAILINGRPVFQRLVLDQGFYPDGVYTAPSDEALRGDIELSMSLGFNGARLHQKIFEERFLYWADRLGYIVWGEHANWGLDHTRPESLMRFLPEWLEAVNRDFNHPSIVGWCPFNETWDIDGRKQDDEVLRGVYLATKAADTTRPVIDTSGNFHVVTDVYDVHDYEQNVETFQARYGAVTREEVYESFPARQKYAGQPYFVSEFGGTWWAPGREDGWGYGQAPRSEEEVAARFEGLTKALLDNPNIAAYCYTQLTDIEQEQNGLVTYGREKKFSDEVYGRIFKAQARAAAIEEKD